MAREKRTNVNVMSQQKRHSVADNATQEDQCHPRKIFVGGLAHKTTTQHLREHFLRHGPIVDAVVLRWPDGRSRGFGYVTFADVGAASAGLRTTHHIGGRLVDVKRAVPGTNKLFVGGLPQNTTAQELREHFETFGVVSDAVVMIDPATSRSRGFGFICFLPGQEGASAVASALEQYEYHHIRGKWIEVKSASPPHRLVPKDGASSSATDADSELGDMSVKSAAPTHREESKPTTGGRPVASPCGRWEEGPGYDRADEDRGSNQGSSQGYKTPPVLGEPRKVALPRPTGTPPTPYSDQLGAAAPMPEAAAAPSFHPMHAPWMHAMAAAAAAAAQMHQQAPPPGLAAALAGYAAGLHSQSSPEAAGQMGNFGNLGGAPWPPPPPAHTAVVPGGAPPGLANSGQAPSRSPGGPTAAHAAAAHAAMMQQAVAHGYGGNGFLDASPDFHLNLERLLRQYQPQAALY